MTNPRTAPATGRDADEPGLGLGERVRRQRQVLLRELAQGRPLTLLTATRTADISAAAVLADLLNDEKKSD